MKRVRIETPVEARTQCAQAVLVAALLLALVGNASAATLIGRVVDPGGVGVPGVNLDLFDEATGDEIDIVNDSTDLNGDFSIVVPDNATYEVRFLTDLATRLLPRSVGGVIVTTGVVDMGTTALENAALLTAVVVRSDTMAAVVGADTDVDVSATGARVLTPGDNTDATGRFSVLVPLTSIDLTIEPQKIQKLVALEIPNIAIAGDTDLGVIQVEPGALLSGTVRRSSNNTVVEDADIDVFDSATGNEIPTSGDDSDDFGVFSVVVPFGTIDYAVKPQKDDRLVAERLAGIEIVADTDVGNILLDAGALLTGTVVRTSGGAPVVGADTDSADAYTGAAILTPGDDTNGAGVFSIVVPFGTIELSIEPRTADRLVALRFPDLDVNADMNLGVLSLDDGFLVSGFVNDGGANPVSGTSAKVYDEAGGERVPTPGSASAADGSYGFILPAGTFLAGWSAPIEGGTDRVYSPGFVVNADRTFDPVTTATPCSVVIGGTGHLVNAGDRYTPIVSVRNNSGSSLPVRALVTAEVPSRSIVKSVQPPIDKTLPGASRVISKPLRVRIPANVSPALLGVPVHLVVRIENPSNATLYDEDRIEFRIR